MEIRFNNLAFMPNVAPLSDEDFNNGAAEKEHGSPLKPSGCQQMCRLPRPLPADAHLIVCAEVLVVLHHLQLAASPHQNRPHPSARQVCVKLGRKYVDSS